MATIAPEAVFGSNSPNHGGRGQNVLYVGGNVKWLTAPTMPTIGCENDDIYLNRSQKSRPAWIVTIPFWDLASRPGNG